MMPNPYVCLHALIPVPKDTQKKLILNFPSGGGMDAAVIMDLTNGTIVKG
jgi:hypothetical protein